MAGSSPSVAAVAGFCTFIIGTAAGFWGGLGTGVGLQPLALWLGATLGAVAGLPSLPMAEAFSTLVVCRAGVEKLVIANYRSNLWVAFKMF